MKRITNEVLTAKFKEAVSDDKENYDSYFIIDEYPDYAINNACTVRRLDNGKKLSIDDRGRYKLRLDSKAVWVHADTLKEMLSKITVTNDDLIIKAKNMGCGNHAKEAIKELYGLTDPAERELALIQKIKNLQEIISNMDATHVKELNQWSTRYRLLKEQYNELASGLTIPKEEALAAFEKLMGKDGSQTNKVSTVKTEESSFENCESCRTCSLTKTPGKSTNFS